MTNFSLTNEQDPNNFVVSSVRHNSLPDLMSSPLLSCFFISTSQNDLFYAALESRVVVRDSESWSSSKLLICFISRN